MDILIGIIIGLLISIPHTRYLNELIKDKDCTIKDMGKDLKICRKTHQIKPK